MVSNKLITIFFLELSSDHHAEASLKGDDQKREQRY